MRDAGVDTDVVIAGAG
ncbi:hypothetical protein, partial [Frankia sp. AvcI1]